jgi:hypothetical protein
MIQISEQERISRAVRCVRHYIRDKKQLNRLLQGQYESDDIEVKQALFFALEDWNNTPPPIGKVSLANHPAKHLLIEAAAIEVIKGAALWHSREHMPSSDGGTSADDHAKANEYTMWLERAIQDYERKKGDYKLQQNLSAALGNMGAPSEYAFYHLYGEDLVW